MKITILGCKVEITFPFVALLCTMIILQNPYTVLWGFFSILVHEIGHITYMIHSHTPPSQIKLTAFSIDIVDVYSSTRNLLDSIRLAISGPLANFLTSGLIFALYSMSHINFLIIPLWGNFFLGCFNLLPIMSLDGYQIFFSLLSMYISSSSVSKIMKIVSIVTLIPLILTGLFLLFHLKYNFSLLAVCIYLTFLLFS